ncbi:hypothetical protein Hypma_012314 [Hypsizygus marmoreus]|uniref:Uncharacterized protein n=1 Tax=Hypsizygus marmoreus TaxID=39966 RepID=A0A369JJM9_HYPMA|nr:hypothetical protein Hypma_012314 [Hypsizygus marmoreus]
MPQCYLLVGLPLPLSHTASWDALWKQVNDLCAIADAILVQIQCDYAQMQLMDSENKRPWQCAYYKEQKKAKRLEMDGHLWHMTGEKSLDALAHAEWVACMKEFFKEMGLKEQQKEISNQIKYVALAEKVLKAEQKRAEAEVEKKQKEEKACVQAKKVAEKVQKAEERQW